MKAIHMSVASQMTLRDLRDHHFKLALGAVQGRSVPRMEGDPAFKDLVTTLREGNKVGVSGDGGATSPEGKNGGA